MTLEAAFDTPDYAATSARLSAGRDDSERAVEPTAEEVAELARRVREFEKTMNEVKAMHNAFAALRDLDEDSLARALPWLNDRLFAQQKFRDDEPART